MTVSFGILESDNNYSKSSNDVLCIIMEYYSVKTEKAAGK